MVADVLELAVADPADFGFATDRLEWKTQPLNRLV
jgi:hypothetical protein